MEPEERPAIEDDTFIKGLISHLKTHHSVIGLNTSVYHRMLGVLKLQSPGDDSIFLFWPEPDEFHVEARSEGKSLVLSFQSSI